MARMAQQIIRIRAHWDSRSVWVNGEPLAAKGAIRVTGLECAFEWGSFCQGARQLAAALLLRFRPVDLTRQRIDEVAQSIGEFPFGNFDVDITLDALLEPADETAFG
jgi:hypothetical protein